MEPKEKITSKTLWKTKKMEIGLRYILYLIILTFIGSCKTPGEYVLENSFTRLVIKDNRIVSLFDKARSIEHVSAQADSSVGLFHIQLVKEINPEFEIDARQMDAKVLTHKSEHLEIEFSHTEVKVIVDINLSSETGEIVWSISAAPSNKNLSVSLVTYPVFETGLTANGAMKQCLIPAREGLLQPINERLFTGGSCIYPAWLFAQMIGCLQEEGGFLLWTDDPLGHVKGFDWIPGDVNAKFSIRHLMTYVKGETWKQSYKVRLSFCDKEWQDAADIYRDWASTQHFCNQKFRDRADIPQILHHPPMSVNAAMNPENNIEMYPEILAKWSEFIDAPVICRAVRWEKYQPWVGTDYFPPVMGESRFLKMTEKLKELNVVIAPDVSAYKWESNILKKNRNVRGTPEQVLKDNALIEKYFLENGGPLVCEIQRDGSLTKYFGGHRICRGTTYGKAYIQNIAKKLFDLGVTAYHDDQDVGMWPDGVEGCFNPDHGHPIPCGTWSTQNTVTAFREMRAEAESRGNKNFFISKEFCSELLNMEMHIHLTRPQSAFKGGWEEPNPFIIPLVNYLYHEYIPSGMEPSFAESSELDAAAASVIFGQIPGAGYNTAMDIGAGSAPESFMLQLLEDYYKSMKVYSKDFLLYGKMIHPLVKNIPVRPTQLTEVRGRKLLQPVLFNDPLIIQSAWEDYLGNVGSFAVNVQSSEIVLQVPSPGEGKWQAAIYRGDQLQQTQTVSSGDSLKWVLAPGRLEGIIFKPVN